MEKMADRIPNTLESITVDLLIGLDYFWDVMEGDKVVLPSGSYVFRFAVSS